MRCRPRVRGSGRQNGRTREAQMRPKALCLFVSNTRTPALHTGLPSIPLPTPTRQLTTSLSSPNSEKWAHRVSVKGEKCEILCIFIFHPRSADAPPVLHSHHRWSPS